MASSSRGRWKTRSLWSRLGPAGGRTEPRPKEAVHGNSERGSALLTVLWLSVALFAIAFTLAHMVRAEIDRVSTDADSFRARYLAMGGIERAILWEEWTASGAVAPGTGKPFYVEPQERFHYQFPSGEADVEMIPESSRLDINHATVEDLAAVMLAAGAARDQAAGIAQAIVDWRSGGPGTISGFDRFYMSLQPSFRSPHTSFQEIEEVAMVRGMTPELFYGGYRQGPEGQLLPYGGVRECLSTYGTINQFDVNSVSPILLSAIGVPPGAVSAIMHMRSIAPIKSMGQISGLLRGPAAGRLTTDNGMVWTARATARLRFADGRYSEVKRTVSAEVRFFKKGDTTPDRILRWYDESPPAPSSRPVSAEFGPPGLLQ
jgi:general secretion pathway protein K